MSWSIAIPCIIAAFVVAIVYIYTSKSENSSFVNFWGLSWIAYFVGVLLIITYHLTNSETYLLLRKLTDMLSLLLILFMIFALIRVKIPTYWYRFSTYMLLLAFLCYCYKLQLLSLCLPISIFQLIIVIVICYQILVKLNIRSDVRILTATMFAIWGLYKSGISIYEIFDSNQNDFFVYELMFVSVLNIVFLLLCTRNKKAEIDLSESIYKTIVEQSKDTIFYYQFKPYESFKYVTPSIETLTGYTANEYYRDPHFFMKQAPNESFKSISEIFSASSDYHDVSVVKMVRKNNEEYWAEFQRTPVYDDNGTLIAMECTIRDISELHTSQLEQIEVTKNRNMLLSYISHELRTPITSIAGYLTAIQDGVMTTEEEKNEALDIITTKTITLKTLVDDLDQLTKLETNRFTFDFIITNVGEFTEQLIAKHKLDVESQNFTVRVDANISHLYNYWIIIDSVRIEQVFTNLISNAVKYSSLDRQMTWRFTINQAEDNLVISVEDKGIGIRSNDLIHIFDKFYRADTSRSSIHNTRGRGLGLTLCKEIVRAHNGDIFAESEYDIGSKFIFYIPLYKEEP